jgi:hypothetical protein
MLRHLLSCTSSSTLISHVAISNILPNSTAASHSDINHAFAIKPSAVPAAKPTETPALQSSICATPKSKSKGSKRAKNVFHNDHSFPNQLRKFDAILHSINGGCILCKRKHSAPPLNTINSNFHVVYDKALHGAKLHKEIDLSHLDSSLQAKVYGLIQKYWSVFDDKGQFVPVKDYSFIIDTGNARPIMVKKIHYGPREIPIMCKCIASLEKLGHIRQIHEGKWQFKAVLAPKPHQEDITDIGDFVWRFCVNFIPLNQITWVIAYPIPRCNSAVHLAFGMAFWYWMWDAPQGYHQICVAKSSQVKLAFAGPDTAKWAYNVMQFGPVNGPSTFIAFIHDMDGTWKDLACSLNLIINNDLNTTIIVDDIVSWAKNLLMALVYMECQLCICQSQNLSLSLKKLHIFVKWFEFVGVDVCIDGNQPAMSKHQLLNTWTAPELVRNVAKFVCFIQFYACFIPHFEVRITTLRVVLQNEYTDLINPYWSDNAKAAFEEMRQAILSNPCLRRFNHHKLLVLCTDFSANCFGYVACQPANNDLSLAAMNMRMQGSHFHFITKESQATPHPIAFGCPCTRGNKTCLHLHLGKGFLGKWSINKCRHMCLGKHFTLVTDCYAIKFILSYDGCNPAVLWLQMRFMCWDMDIKHRNDHWLTDANYFSCLGADLYFDQLLKDYIQPTDFL